ncbi:MAG: universal stress protein [Candidatus Eremiobacteraeota bacterium]|nr:universal stress protein [Candidatus Eremiobacteraeota bacterium]MBV8262392.1 universal stress protein [Candidatus Eremiobacteraeota bacterium]
MFTSILTPVDGSPPSDAAVKLAIAMAKAYKAKLLFLYAVAIPLPVHDAGGFAREQIMQEEQTRGDEILGEAMKLAKDAGVAAQTQLVGGSVSEAVLTAADEHGCDVIVMGTHGRTGIARAVLGSKTADVIARSPLPVLVAPHLS